MPAEFEWSLKSFEVISCHGMGIHNYNREGRGKCCKV